MCQSNISTQQVDRICIVCSKKIYGRSDKVFCDITCKNYYHSEVRKTTRTITSETLKILKRNFIILEGFMTEKADKFTIQKVKLEKEGFKFQYVTNFLQHKRHITYSLFNLDYFIGNNNQIVVRRKQSASKISPYLFKRWLNDLPDKMAA